MIGKNIATYSSKDGALTLQSDPPSILLLPELLSLFALPSGPRKQEIILGITSSLSVFQILYTSSHPPTLMQQSHHSLPPNPSSPSPVKMILPVDPMAWSAGNETLPRPGTELHDMLLSVSEEGELAFWILEEGLPSQNQDSGASKWRCTGRVRTGRKGFNRAKCSSAKKSALGNKVCFEMMKTMLTLRCNSRAWSWRRRAHHLGFKGIRVCLGHGVPHHI